MSISTGNNAELLRLHEDGKRVKNWKRWGPYLPERQWGTVREDYSDDGTCWEHFTHDHARSRAYRWGEDGLLGFTDRECRLCFSLALWNENDSILKERLFGLSGPEGNHGEDVKEEYFYLDSTPTHSYCKALYKYPQAEFPYAKLVEENRKRDRSKPEYELADTGVFANNRYFDVTVEYAKESPNDLLIKITVQNRAARSARLHLLPTVCFRNTWIWGCRHEGCSAKPRILHENDHRLRLEHESLGKWFFETGPENDARFQRFLFTENETNRKRLFGTMNYASFVKDAFHEYIIGEKKDAVNPRRNGTKAAPHYIVTLGAGESITFRQRLYSELEAPDDAFADFDSVFEKRTSEANTFYRSVIPENLGAEEKNVVRQGYAGLLWSKQFYHYIVNDWLEGDINVATPSQERKRGRNSSWRHIYSRDIISMPDKWEYPWFAAWDLAFHMVPFANIDPHFAKEQISLLLREWYMHPNGQLPAYEFAFGDVNPPVHAWAAWRVYKMSARGGKRDRAFLESVFQKLLLNFTWWVNRKDEEGHNIFSGGFLGLDNIGVFDRSKPLPTGGKLQQADGTAWMAFYCSTMLSMALELAWDGEKLNVAYEDMASKFLEHFVQIVDAMNSLGNTGLWDEKDGFYYDQILYEHHADVLKTRSLVGLLPLIAVEVFDEDLAQHLPGFRKRTTWFLKYRKDLARHIYRRKEGDTRRWILAIPPKARLKKVLSYMLDENEFLSPYGIRSLSKFHEKNPFVLHTEGQEHTVSYTPGESNTWLFGGNSNWRGPIWFPVNFLLIEALERYHHFYGDELKVEFPTGSGRKLNLKEIASEISHRLTKIFLRNERGQLPFAGNDKRFQNDPAWKDLVMFHEYFHGETAKGLGASHQTGWTALVVKLLEDLARER